MFKIVILFFIFFLVSVTSNAQMLTGVWHGVVTKQSGFIKKQYKLELKIIYNGDSLTGTSYYYISANNYYRYAIRGYKNFIDNTVIWWDDELLDSKIPKTKLSSPLDKMMSFEAEFNCPGSGIMKLDGNATDEDNKEKWDTHLQKSDKPIFKDEWDWVIENYTFGANDKSIIDSVAQIAYQKNPTENLIEKNRTNIYIPKNNKEDVVTERIVIRQEDTSVIVFEKPTFLENKKNLNQGINEDTLQLKKPTNETIEIIEKTPEGKPVSNIITKKIDINEPITIDNKFLQRKKEYVQTIPIIGDSIEMTFYDNAEVDGDSISLFLNDKLIHTNIRLNDKGFVFKLLSKDLPNESNLVMVAENLGMIPPNTAVMIVTIGVQRYEARLKSTEESSALIKLVKQ